ncbi:monovalent cation/H(+) antiporter subunit G [Pelagicoccus sp. SDUM812005]|uniref:monovalent cation/H(+) antiporter subunit G n=1 Tax=Pelagicoccus sp. SDUM812005 TaxID=3041257 RepID=UPI00280D1A27|nr:monovalent cation/H(+) antiporter subunit G [Pelagicoccus sp. SDUM812005]MDQ8180535.1 monovalent cation/H(+) antiporter subunit G [Pelagicoccus sp. SDUM812005]
MSVSDIIGSVLVFVGLLGMLIGSIGLVRLPDFFARTHAASKVDTVGVIVAVVGIAIISGLTLDALKVLLIGFFLLLTNPVAAHALGRAAWKSGLKPWRSDAQEAKSEEAGK